METAKQGADTARNNALAYQNEQLPKAEANADKIVAKYANVSDREKLNGYRKEICDLVTYNKSELLKFRNFGKKSLNELDDLLKSLNLSFGTDISKYKLDKD